MGNFTPPQFTHRSLEIRIESNKATIYGTQTGLRKLAKFCIQLADSDLKQGTDHIHLEDYGLLTEKSFSLDLVSFSDHAKTP